MNTLLPVINQLQDLMTLLEQKVPTTLKPDLPQIIVVGAQSVGKSSLLEALVGHSFLPRGPGMVTKRPLVLQLTNPRASASHHKNTLNFPESPISENYFIDPVLTKSDKFSNVFPLGEDPYRNSKEIVKNEDFGYFLHYPGKIYKNFDHIRQEIIAETERVLENSKTISPLPISLKISSSRVIDITLVDLPGIIKIPVENQPTNIETQIQNLILSYISHPNSIILAVCPANVDLSNSDALKLARTVDPTGQRTIGVLTKCDLIDESVNVVDILSGKLYPLKIGYAAVAYVGHQDEKESFDMSASLKREEDFFDSHLTYRGIRHRCGTRFLAVLLHQTLLQRIQQVLPEIRQKIAALVEIYQTKLADYGHSLSTQEIKNGSGLLQYLTLFSKTFHDVIDGQVSSLDTCLQLCGGARLRYILHDWLEAAFKEFNFLEDITDYEMRTVIRNASGVRGSLFLSEASFDLLVREQIMKLRAPAFQCVHLIYRELHRIVMKCTVMKLQQFQSLRENILGVVQSMLSERLEPTVQMVSDLFNMETSYINLNHPDFVSLFRFNHLLPQSSAGTLIKPCLSGVERLLQNSPIPTINLQDQESLSCSVSNKSLGCRFGYLRPFGLSLYPFKSSLMGKQTSPSSSGSRKNILPLDMARTLKNEKDTPLSESRTCTLLTNEGFVMSDHEQAEISLMRFSVTSYLEIVRKNMTDHIPKVIMFSMVNVIKDKMYYTLVSQLYKPELFEVLLYEGENSIRAREECYCIVRLLSYAGKTLSQISQMRSTGEG